MPMSEVADVFFDNFNPDRIMNHLSQMPHMQA